MMARTTGPTWTGFIVLALIGAAFILGFLTLSVLFVVPVVVAVVVAVVRPNVLKSSFGLMAGAGSVLIYVAYVQRRGPGTGCWQTATASGCDEYLNPWPWLVVGLTLVVAGILAHLSQMRRATRNA